MSECLNCGDTDNLSLHPDYSDGTCGNHLCPDCFISLLEEKVDEARDELIEAQRRLQNLRVTVW